MTNKTLTEALEEDFDKLDSIDTEDFDTTARSHVETGAGYNLECWCEIGHDHTFDEWVAFETGEEA